MKDEKCGNCRFYLVEKEDIGLDGSVCRRFPPLQLPMSEIDDGFDLFSPEGYFFPIVQPSNWCGEYRRVDPVPVAPANPTALIASLDPDEIRARLVDLREEQEALRILLRAALANNRKRQKGKPTPAPDQVESGDGQTQVRHP